MIFFTSPKLTALKGCLGRLILLACGLILPLLMLEVGARLLDLAPPSTPNPAIWTPHPLFGWWHIPYSGGIFHSDYNEFATDVRINARGLRDREIGYDNPTKALRVLSLADSFGESLQVKLEDTYHKQLEKSLSQSLDRPVEVLNAGVGGWGTDQEAIFYVAEGFRYQPDVVLLAFFVENDTVNNYAPLEIARAGGSQQKNFFSLSPKGELIPPKELALDSKKTATQTPSANSPSFLLETADTLWLNSALYRVFVPYLRDMPPVVQRLGATGILGGEGIVRATHPATPISLFIYQDPPNLEFTAAWNLTEAIIARLRDEVAKRGATLAVVIIGAPEQVYPSVWQNLLANHEALRAVPCDVDAPNRRLNQFLTAQKIPHLDLLPIFRQAATQPNAPLLHLRHDQHWTVAGHQLAAEAIQQFLLSEVIAK